MNLESHRLHGIHPLAWEKLERGRTKAPRKAQSLDFCQVFDIDRKKPQYYPTVDIKNVFPLELINSASKRNFVAFQNL